MDLPQRQARHIKFPNVVKYLTIPCVLSFRTYITSPGKLSHGEAIDYCLGQHSAGLVIWDSDDKYQDVKYIVGRNGKDKKALTALYNPNKDECTPAAPCGANGKLVRYLLFMVVPTCVIN